MTRFLVSGLAGLAISIFLSLAASSPAPAAWDVKCGGKGEKACTTWSARKSSSKPGCPKGSQLNLDMKCYACPSGYKRTINPDPTAPTACERPAYTDFKKPRYTGRTYCAANHFIGSIDTGTCREWKCRDGFEHWSSGKCYSCDGYNRNANSIDSAKGCDKTIAAVNAKTTKKSNGLCPKDYFADPRNGGECWQCPSGFDRNANAVTHAAACTAQKACGKGLYHVGSFCEDEARPKHCGREGQTACKIWEFVPSCKEGLMESPRKAGECVKAPKGASPFFATIGEATEVVWEALQPNPNACLNMMRNADIKLPFMTASLEHSGFGGQCAQSVMSGTLCEAIGIGDIFAALGDLGKDGTGIFKGIEKDYLRWRGSKVCKDAERKAEADIKDPVLGPALTELTGLSCGISMMLGGDLTRDMICLGKASEAGVFSLGGDGRATRQSCENFGKAVGQFMDTVTTFLIVGKMTKPLKERFKKYLIKRKRAKISDKAHPGDRAFLKNLEKDFAKAERTIDRLFKIGKWTGVLKAGVDGTRAVSKIPECTVDWTEADKRDAGAPLPPKGGKTSKSDFFYAINDKDELVYFELAKGNTWNQIGVDIGIGFKGRFSKGLFSGGFHNGFSHFYGIEKDGTLIEYAYDHTRNKLTSNGTVLGTGWGGFAHVFSGGGGRIYAVTKDGDLLAYLHKGKQWPIAAMPIGAGFDPKSKYAAGGGGEIYEIRPNGDLVLHRHNANFGWVILDKTIGGGFNVFPRVVSTGGGKLYMTRPDGNLYTYQHDPAQAWKVSNTKVGDGWSQAFGDSIFGMVQQAKLPAQKKWVKLPGGANDIGVGAGGAVWVIGGGKTPAGDFDIYKYTGNRSWTKVAGNALRIDVDAKGNPWVVTAGDQIYQHNGSTFVHVPGGAKDIGIGGGKVWVIGNNAGKGGYDIYRRDGNRWTKIAGSAVRIDVDHHGNPWVVNSFGGIYRYNGKTFQDVSGNVRAQDIGVGANGTVTVLDKKGAPYFWTGAGWYKLPGAAKHVSVSSRGEPWVVNAAGDIYTWQ